MFGEVNQNSMIKMQMMTRNTLALNQGMRMGNNFFFFNGNSLSLQARLDSLTLEDTQKIVDAHITVTGIQIQAMNTCSYMCTAIWGGIIIIPLFFLCMDWWKRCTLPAFTIAPSVYMSFAKLLSAPNIRNLTLHVKDNTFDGQKASILYNALTRSGLKGFTFINQSGAYDFSGNQYSDFITNMRPIKLLSNVMSDIRWGNEIVI